MALWTAISRGAPRRDCEWRLHIAHVHHGLRGSDADADARFVADHAATLGHPMHVHRVNTRDRAKADRHTLEQAARDARYRFFARIAARIDADGVAVAHHADDQAETVLHHILRGSGLRGLAGMPARRPLSGTSAVPLIRPMLELKRDDVMRYLAALNVPHRSDASNQDAAHTRNRIRNDLLPLIRSSINPAATDALLRLASQARAASDLIDRAAARLLDAAAETRSKQKPGVLSLPLADFRRRPPIIRTAIIRAALERLGVPLRRIGHERLTAAAEMLDSGRGGRRVEFAGGAGVTRRGPMVIIDAGTAAK